MNFIKRNKKLLVVITVFLVALVAGIQLKNILYPSGGAIYGNRLDGIKEVELAKDLDRQIKEKLKDFVSKVEVRTSGRIVNITMIVNPDISASVAKDNSKKIFELFAEKQLNYYDIQVFLKKETDATDFPIIGYKHQNKDGFTWTKDRA